MWSSFLPFLSLHGHNNAVHEWALNRSDMWSNDWNLSGKVTKKPGKLEFQWRNRDNGPANVIRLRSYSSTLGDLKHLFSVKICIMCTLKLISVKDPINIWWVCGIHSAWKKRWLNIFKPPIIEIFPLSNSGGLIAKAAHFCPWWCCIACWFENRSCSWLFKRLGIKSNHGNIQGEGRNQTDWQSNDGYSGEREIKRQLWGRRVVGQE